MSSVNTAIQLITREQAASNLAAASTCSPALARGPWDYDLAEALAGLQVEAAANLLAACSRVMGDGCVDAAHGVLLLSG